MTGFRPALDISDLTSPAIESGLRGGMTPAAKDWYNQPRRAGPGPLVASSCTTLARSPELIFDVNGYYRAFGFIPPFADITRKALRLAYHELHGEESVWLTAVLRLLLDPEKRRAYDCAPFGERHFDEIEQARIMAETKRRAARHTRGPDTLATLKDLLDQQGLSLDEDSPNEHYQEGEDTAAAIMHTGALPLDEQPWEWGYYRWSTSRADTARLARWQQMLVRQLAAQEVSIRFCVGFIGRSRTDSRFVVARTYGVRTVYLREDVEPEQDMATLAVDALLSDQ